MVCHMDTSLAAAHAAATAYAGPDFRWNDSPIKSKRGDELTGLTHILAFDVQGGMCAACGTEFEAGEAIQLCHIVASRKNGFGVMAGNVYAGHIGCNDDDYKRYGDTVPLTSFYADASLVPTSLPTRQASLARHAELGARREARRARRA
jgi:hypothetical protein